jgi:hypothetical protein
VQRQQQVTGCRLNQLACSFHGDFAVGPLVFSNRFHVAENVGYFDVQIALAVGVSWGPGNAAWINRQHF